MSIKKLQQVFEFAYANEYSGFYRDHYGDAIDDTFMIRSLEDWWSLPLLTKEDLQRVAVSDRVFLPDADLRFLQHTSGTSGNKPLISFRNNLYERETMSDLYTPTGVFVVGSPLPFSEISYRAAQPDIVHISGDPTTLPQSVALAAEYPIDTIGMFLKTFETAVPLLQQQGMCEAIQYVYIWGEAVSQTKYNWFKTVFPNATMVIEYGASDTQINNIGLSVGAFDEKGAVYQSGRRVYLECIDPKTGTVITEVGKVGEMVVTTLPTDSSLPLLRYRLGDLMEYVSVGPDGWYCTFRSYGRSASDAYRVPGGEITTLACQDAMSKAFGKDGHIFQLQIKEQGELFATTIVTLRVPRISTYTETEVAKRFSQELLLAPGVTYCDGIARRGYPVIECIFDDTLKDTLNLKRKYLDIVRQ